MIKKYILSWWVVTILSIIYLYLIDLFGKYIVSKNGSTEIQIVLVLVVFVYTYFMFRLLYNFIYKFIKG